VTDKITVQTTPLQRHAVTWLGEKAFILSYLGSILTVIGVVMYIPLIPWFIYHEGNRISAFTFIIPATATLLLGLAAQRRFELKAPSVRDAMIITAIGWVLISLAGAMPFIIGLHQSFINSFFEAVSGFTTTGITVFEGLDAMPRSILFWRSFIQWLGGLGILTFFLAVSFRGGSAAASLFGAEGHKISSARPVPGIFHTVRILWGIYIVLTLASIITYYLGGMSGFDALNHSLTNISTGGFSTHDASIGYYAGQHYPHAVLLEYATIFFMLAGGMNFLIHFRVANGNVKALITDFEMRWFWGIIIGATALMVLDHFVHAPGRPLAVEKVFRDCLFQVASMISSTGFATRDINSAFFPAMSKQIFFLLMIVGGCVGSTAGGIKVLRVGILVQMFKTQLFRIIAPRQAVSPVIVQGHEIAGQELERIAALFTAWLLLIAIGAGFTAFFSNLDAWQSLSGMASAVGNMGPFYFSVHKMASLNWSIKAVYIFGMLAGRLEILPLAVLFMKGTWKK